MSKKEFIAQWKSAKQDLEEVQNKRKDLDTRRTALIRQKEELQSAVMSAEQGKKSALDQFARNEIGQEELERARSAYDNAVKAVGNIGEIIEATDRAYADGEKSISSLTEKLKGTERMLFMDDFKEQVSALCDGVRDKLVLAYVTKRRSGIYAGWDHFFFQDVFGRAPDIPELNKAEAALDKKLS